MNIRNADHESGWRSSFFLGRDLHVEPPQSNKKSQLDPIIENAKTTLGLVSGRYMDPVVEGESRGSSACSGQR
jgi:hypothetical protein